MNITIISTSLPFPLSSGGAQAQFNMIDKLRFEHNISFVFPERSLSSRKHLTSLLNLWPNVKFFPYSINRQIRNFTFLKEKTIRLFKLLFLSHNRNFIVERILKPYGYYVNHDFLNFILSVIQENRTDIVQIEFYPYLKLINHIHGDYKTIFVHHEIRYVRNSRMLEGISLSKKEQDLFSQLKRQEIDDLNKFNSVITLTDNDKTELLSAGVYNEIFVSPAAINTLPSSYKGWNGSLVFIGGVSHIPNKEGLQWFFENVYPLIDSRKVKNIKIIGSGWQHLFIEKETIPIQVCGFVEKLEDFVAGCINIVPLLSGSGMRMKILEAAAMGIPTITTTVGVEGLPFANGKSCIVADTYKEFANAINNLASDENLQRLLTTNARTIFDENFSKEKLSKRRNDIYKHITSK